MRNLESLNPFHSILSVMGVCCRIAVGSDHPVATLPAQSAFSQVESHPHTTSRQVKRRHEGDCFMPNKQMKGLSNDEKEKTRKTQMKLFAGQDGSLKVQYMGLLSSIILDTSVWFDYIGFKLTS